MELHFTFCFYTNTFDKSIKDTQRLCNHFVSRRKVCRGTTFLEIGVEVVVCNSYLPTALQGLKERN